MGSCKGIEIGGVYKTNSCGLLEVLDIDGHEKVTVRFVDTGYTTDVNVGDLRQGKVRDWTGSLRESVGKVFPTANCGDVVVIEYINSKKVLVQFEVTGHREWFTAGCIKSGAIMDRMSAGIGGGFLGVGDYTFKTHKKEHQHWRSMLERCSSNEEKFSMYFDVTITDEWLDFQNFAAWCQTQKGFMEPGWQLDKDIMVCGSKVYSPSTCCFVPGRINGLVIRTADIQGTLPAKWNKWVFSYREAGGHKVQKAFDTQSEGKYWYKENKERVVKEVADQYKNILDSRVYEALYSWQVN